MYQSNHETVTIDSVLGTMDKKLQLNAAASLNAWKQQLNEHDELAAKNIDTIPTWLETTDATFAMSVALAKFQADFNRCVHHLLCTAYDHKLLTDQIRIMDNGCLLIQSDAIQRFQHLAHRYLQNIALMNEKSRKGVFTISPAFNGKRSLIIQIVSPTSLFRRLDFTKVNLTELNLGQYSHGQHFKLKDK